MQNWSVALETIILSGSCEFFFSISKRDIKSVIKYIFATILIVSSRNFADGGDGSVPRVTLSAPLYSIYI